MGKDILVIGGNSGIGLEVVKQLAASGDGIYAASRSDSELQKFAQVSVQSHDVTDKDAELDLPEKLDGLVYCPGTITLKPFHRLSADDFQNELEVNFLGAVRAIQQALPALKKADHASIVLFSTVAVQTGLSFHASIAGAKGALEGLTRSLAAEFSPKIRVNALALSLTDTPLAGNLLGSEEKQKASADRHPLKRVGSPEEVAKAATFLLGEDSGFITGQIIQIDGGISALKML